MTSPLLDTALWSLLDQWNRKRLISEKQTNFRIEDSLAFLNIKYCADPSSFMPRGCQKIGIPERFRIFESSFKFTFSYIGIPFPQLKTSMRLSYLSFGFQLIDMIECIKEKWKMESTSKINRWTASLHFIWVYSFLINY